MLSVATISAVAADVAVTEDDAIAAGVLGDKGNGNSIATITLATVGTIGFSVVDDAVMATQSSR